MFHGNIHQRNKEESSLPAIIQKAIEYLRKTDFSKMEDQKHLLDGEKMFLVLSSYETKPADQRKAECHRIYIDVQYLISGREKIGFGSEGRNNQILEEYSPQIDAAFYKIVDDEKWLELHNGDYAVFFPKDIHRPGCSSGESCSVRKAVVKIAVEMLESRSAVIRQPE